MKHLPSFLLFLTIIGIDKIKVGYGHKSMDAVMLQM